MIQIFHSNYFYLYKIIDQKVPSQRLMHHYIMIRQCYCLGASALIEDHHVFGLSPLSATAAKSRLEACVADISKWMHENLVAFA